jgi:transposase
MGKLSESSASITRMALDLAKNVFQAHGVDARGEVVLARKVRRSELLRFAGKLGPCEIVMEACGSAHHWARELMALGHSVKLIPPAHVKPYVRRNKNDAADAAAICEAAMRPGQRFTPVRSVENQAQLMRHRVRDQLVGQRTALLNGLRGHLSEIGVVAAQGAQNAYRLKRMLTDGVDEDGVVQVPDNVRLALAPLARQIDALDAAIETIDRHLAAGATANDKTRRLMSIPGIGPVTASAIAATVPDMRAFASGREFSAFLGLTPRQHSSGGKERLGRITKMGDRYLRRLLVVGATAVLHHATGHNDALRRWARQMLERKGGRSGFKLTAVALANKLARLAFAILRSGSVYDDRPVAA